MKPELAIIAMEFARQCRKAEHKPMTCAEELVATLKASGYAIVLDEAQLLEKGREVKIHE